MEFRHFVQLIAIGLQARVPMHMTGFPGVGKTELTKALAAFLFDDEQAMVRIDMAFVRDKTSSLNFGPSTIGLAPLQVRPN